MFIIIGGLQEQAKAQFCNNWQHVLKQCICALTLLSRRFGLRVQT